MGADSEVPAELVFSTDGKKRPERIPITLTVDDHQLTAYKPKDALLGRLVTVARRGVSLPDQIFRVYEFLDACFDTESSEYLAARLEDPEDPFDFDDLIDIMLSLLDAWGMQLADNRAQRRAKR
jgi:hypothetical protein